MKFDDYFEIRLSSDGKYVVADMKVIPDWSLRGTDSELLDMCIEKFSIVRDVLAEVKCPLQFFFSTIPLGSHTCPLCWKYLSRACNGCPIVASTGLKECRGSPYEDLVRYRREMRMGPLVKGMGREIKFLEKVKESINEN